MRVVILAGGSEIVAVAIAEELLAAGCQLAVVSLGQNSLLRGVSDDMLYRRVEWPPEDPSGMADHLFEVLAGWGASADQPWVVLPTEDGGLRLLMEHAERFERICRFGRARRLPLGGLDKAEFFNYLQSSECADLAPLTVVATSVEEAIDAIDGFGGDCIVKPSLKPYSMDLSALGAKAFSAAGRAPDDIRRFLQQAWGLSDRWLIQERLMASGVGESVVWALRDGAGNCASMRATERWKYPVLGGSGCWVQTVADGDGLCSKAKQILDAIDFVGVCELPFLTTCRGNYKVLELNPRPWLQVGLPRAADFPIVVDDLSVLQGGFVQDRTVAHGVSWVNLERLAAAAMSGEQGRRGQALLGAFHAWIGADVVAIHGSPLRHVRRRWVSRMFRRALGLRG